MRLVPHSGKLSATERGKLMRGSGVSFSYNFAYALLGGLTPLLVSYLARFERVGPAYYVACMTIVGLVAALATPSHPLSELDAEAQLRKMRV
jgi:cytochrome c biogenesis factor